MTTKTAKKNQTAKPATKKSTAKKTTSLAVVNNATSDNDVLILDESLNTTNENQGSKSGEDYEIVEPRAKLKKPQ